MQAAFMIPKKFEYQPVRRDETELIQKPVIYTIFPPHFPDTPRTTFICIHKNLELLKNIKSTAVT